MLLHPIYTLALVGLFPFSAYSAPIEPPTYPTVSSCVGRIHSENCTEPSSIPENFSLPHATVTHSQNDNSGTETNGDGRAGGKTKSSDSIDPASEYGHFTQSHYIRDHSPDTGVSVEADGSGTQDGEHSGDNPVKRLEQSATAFHGEYPTTDMCVANDGAGPVSTTSHVVRMNAPPEPKPNYWIPVCKAKPLTGPHVWS